ncbi:hypothetical protein MMC30_008309 [Trapelia coarctata]|nr:hypothetical protein [Trapelia coarctata]
MRACASPHDKDRLSWELGGTKEDTGSDDSALESDGLPALDKMFKLQCRDRDLHDGRSSSTQPQSRFEKFNNAFASLNAPSRNGQPPAKSGRMPPPRIDASGANRPFLQSAQPKPSSSSGMRSTTPTAAASSRSKSPFRPPPRSATAPIYSPPSPDLQLPQDCAFPVFPTAKSRSTTPTTPSAAGRPFENGRPRVQTDSSGIIAPKSLRPDAGGFLSKMNTIAPGPSNVSGNGADGFLPRPPSAGSTRSNRSQIGADITGRINPLSVPWGPGNGVMPASPKSAAFATSPLSAHFPASNTPPPPPSPTVNRTPACIEPLRISVRSQTFPSDGQGRTGAAPSRRPSEPSTANSSAANSASSTYSSATSAASSTSSHPRRPSVSAANRPLHEIGSTSSYRASRPGPSRTASPVRNDTGASAPRSGSRAGERTDLRLNGAPPVPAAIRAEEFSVGNPYHAPRESTSSNGSSSSGVISGSSRSSPPLSETSYRPRRKPSDTPNSDNASSTPQIPNINVTSPPKPSQTGPGPSKSFSRPTYARPAAPPSAETPESPMDPAFQPHQFPPLSPPSKQQAAPRSQQGDAFDNMHHQNASLPLKSHPPQASPPQKNAPRADPVRPFSPQGHPNNTSASKSSGAHTPAAPVLQRPDVPTPARRPTTANKGQCRGCGEIIQGKSVSSADGRLTGRFHKQCFVCKTCKEPFQTADFYVLQNNPYCAWHYHELNGSLCKTCDRGIEGQYLETEVKQKFHPHCFTCQDCRKILRDDYFELNGKVFCEQHAFRAANEPSLLGPGRRHPERRTTRLMMM